MVLPKANTNLNCFSESFQNCGNPSLASLGAYLELTLVLDADPADVNTEDKDMEREREKSI